MYRSQNTRKSAPLESFPLTDNILVIQVQGTDGKGRTKTYKMPLRLYKTEAGGEYLAEAMSIELNDTVQFSSAAKTFGPKKLMVNFLMATDEYLKRLANNPASRNGAVIQPTLVDYKLPSGNIIKVTADQAVAFEREFASAKTPSKATQATPKAKATEKPAEPVFETLV